VRKAAAEMRQLVNSTPVFTLANGITLFRLLLLPPIFLLIRQDDGAASALALLLVILGWLTDGLDGYAARHMGQISELGKILDPLIDKIFVSCLLLFMVLLRSLPGWVLAVIIPRDLLIMIGGYLLARRRRTVERSHIWGKLSTNMLTVTVIAYLLRLMNVAPYLLGLSLALLVISTWNYLGLFLHMLHEPPAA
jgi:CDP-diacylglycerol--glycerol-3-phosphate 3-phosphatidyltransferase